MKRIGLILLSLALLAALPAKGAAAVNVDIGINVGPPAIPVYAEPPAPAPNYIWTPGYWAWGPNGYYWVPGAWALAPAPGLVWTPGYWSYNNGAYYWNAGYWAPQVGFYGGIDYGSGYYGDGYVGGEWQDGVYRYNTAVTNVNRTVIRNVYVDRTVVVNRVVNRVSYNGGPGGVDAHPTLHDEWVEHVEHHEALTATQIHNQVAAADNRALQARVNHGVPKVPEPQHPLTTQSHPEGMQNHPQTVTEPPKRHVEEQSAVTTVHHSTPLQTQPQSVHHEPAHPQTPVHQQHAPVHLSEQHHYPVTNKPAPHPHATRAPQR